MVQAPDNWTMSNLVLSLQLNGTPSPDRKSFFFVTKTFRHSFGVILDTTPMLSTLNQQYFLNTFHIKQVVSSLNGTHLPDNRKTLLMHMVRSFWNIKPQTLLFASLFCCNVDDTLYAYHIIIVSQHSLTSTPRHWLDQFPEQNHNTVRLLGTLQWWMWSADNKTKL